MNWDEFFIQQAELWATKSKDRSTKVGVVVVGEGNAILSAGYNGFPRGVDDDKDERHERPAKYLFTEHAERNAVYNAANIGVSLRGSTVYFNFEPIPCADCCRALIQAGVTRLVGYKRPFPGKGTQWEESLATSRLMLQEAGVEVVELEERRAPEMSNALAYGRILPKRSRD